MMPRTRLKEITEEAASRADQIRKETLVSISSAGQPTAHRRELSGDRSALYSAVGPGGRSRRIWTKSRSSRPDNRNVAERAAGGMVRASSTRKPEANPGAYSEAHLNDGKFDQRWFADGNQAVQITVELLRPTIITRVAWSSDRTGGFTGRFEAPILREYVLEISTDGKLWNKVASSEGRLPPRKEDQEHIVLLAALPHEARESYRRLRNEVADYEARLKEIPKLPTVYAGHVPPTGRTGVSAEGRKRDAASGAGSAGESQHARRSNGGFHCPAGRTGIGATCRARTVDHKLHEIRLLRECWPTGYGTIISVGASSAPRAISGSTARSLRNPSYSTTWLHACCTTDGG